MNFKDWNYRDRALWTKIALILVLIGSFDLGLAGLFGRDVIVSVFGIFISRLFFIIIGIAAGWLCYAFFVEKSQPTM